MPKFSNQLPIMNDVFKSHPRPEAIKGLLESYRVKAKTVLQETMPANIIRLQALIAEEFNPDSPLWVGHIDQGAYKSHNLQLLQPDQVSAGYAGIKITKESDIKIQYTSQTGSDVGGVDDEDILENATSSSADGSDISEDGPGLDDRQKIGARYFDVFAKNNIQEKVAEIVRKEAEELMFNLNDLRVWLSLEVPVIEDGNSFGADVQTHVYDHIEKCFGRASGYMNQVKRHHDDRCLAVAKWAQMPNVADYASSIAASDRIDNILARAYLRNMLVIHAGVMSQLEKNWEKVINPKGQGGSGDAMY